MDWLKRMLGSGFCLCSYDWNWKGAQEEVERAIALNPNSAFAHFVHAHILSDQGRHEEALAEIKRVRELDPVFCFSALWKGCFMLMRVAVRKPLPRWKARSLQQNFWITHRALGKSILNWANTRKRMLNS